MQAGVSSRCDPAPERAGAPDILEAEVARYLSQAIRPLPDGQSVPIPEAWRNGLEGVFAALTHRRFCALSRGKARGYREAILAALADPFRRRAPLEFWFDIGPGYHASLQPGALPLHFEVGLGEFLMLTQIAAFIRTAATLYPPGARFRLVVDNLCALRTNDIAVELTTGYCGRLRQLIEEMNLAQQVQLFVESDEFDVDEFDALLDEVAVQPTLAQNRSSDLDNVARFLGRRCSQAEAVERTGLYHRASAVTERLLDRVVRGVRLTQRATAATLGFRSFPGGDARIQCGEVALVRNAKGSIAPILLTSRNIDFYERARVHCPSNLPSAVKHITFVSRRD